MLRIAIPYWHVERTPAAQARLSSRANSTAAMAHFTTRQNLQLHWSRLPMFPTCCSSSGVEMHCLQTSGNCVRNITADPFAGAAADEIEDPGSFRKSCGNGRRCIRNFPSAAQIQDRGFRIVRDRAAIMVHDIGIEILRNGSGEIGYRVFVGGGLGRTPFIGHEVGSFVPKADILAFLEAVMRVYK